MRIHLELTFTLAEQPDDDPDHIEDHTGYLTEPGKAVGLGREDEA